MKGIMKGKELFVCFFVFGFKNLIFIILVV